MAFEWNPVWRESKYLRTTLILADSESLTSFCITDCGRVSSCCRQASRIDGGASQVERRRARGALHPDWQHVGVHHSARKWASRAIGSSRQVTGVVLGNVANQNGPLTEDWAPWARPSPTESSRVTVCQSVGAHSWDAHTEPDRAWVQGSDGHRTGNSSLTAVGDHLCPQARERWRKGQGSQVTVAASSCTGSSQSFWVAISGCQDRPGSHEAEVEASRGRERHGASPA